MAATGRTFEGWKCPGGSSIPAPSGSYTVGCVDVMHNDLLVRLTYPTSPDSVGQFEYAKWLPHPKYLKAYLSFMKETGLISKRLFETVRISKWWEENPNRHHANSSSLRLRMRNATRYFHYQQETCC